MVESPTILLTYLIQHFVTWSQIWDFFFFFLKDFSFNVNHFFKVFIEFVTVLLLLYVLVFWPRSRWDLSSPHQRWNSHTLHGKVKS